MKFRNKILLAIWGVVLVFLLITSVIIKYWTEVQVEERATADLRSNLRTIRELTTLRSTEIMKSTQIVAETPRVKAAVETGDRNTIRQLAEELNRGLVSDFFALNDAHGRPLVFLRDGLPVTAESVRTVVTEPHAGYRSIGYTVYRYAEVPLIIGTDSIGSLTLGFRFGRQDLFDLQAMTNSDVLLAAGDSIVLGTVPDATLPMFASLMSIPDIARDTAAGESELTRVLPVDLAGEKFLVTALRANGGGSLRLFLLRPVGREVDAALKPVFSTFIILSVVVLLITAVIGYFISQGITRPIGALIHGTSEISQGNYDYRIKVGADAEMRYLAERFEDMSAALKEKIQQLADRNVQLEDALRQLKETQGELVRSERIAATGKLTAQLAHEINNPIHNIQSCLQTLMKRLQVVHAGKDEKELLDVALDEVNRLANLTRQMLDVYKTSLVPLELQPVSLNAIVTEVVAASQKMFSSRKVDVQINLDRSLPEIDGSKDKLKQVFLNLFINAKDAMPSGGTLTVETRRLNGNVLVTVGDTGIGIPAENINKIFDAFFTTKSAVSGVGLGLSVTYGIIRQHEGTISVRSSPGRGSTFSIVLPISHS